MSGAAAAVEEWSQPELVRAIGNLTRAMERFEESVTDTFKDLDRKYVPRELYERDVAARDRELAALRSAVAASVPQTVYDRDMTQLRDRHTTSSTWVRELTAPLVTALMSGAILWAVLGVHHS